MRISDWSSDVCSSDLRRLGDRHPHAAFGGRWPRHGREPVGPDVGARRGGFPQPGDGGPRGLVRAAQHRARDAGGDAALDDDRYLARDQRRSEEHTSELQSLMRISYAVFCLKKKKKTCNKLTKNRTEDNDRTDKA